MKSTLPMAGTALHIFAMASTASSLRLMWRELPRTWTAISRTPAWTVTTFSAPKGSGTTAMSARGPVLQRWVVPTPPCSSPTTQARMRSPFSFVPESRMASAASIMEETPAFILRMPPPNMRLPSMEGVQGSRFQPMARGSMSIWPLNMRDLPPPAALEGGDGLESAGVYLL